MTESKTQRKKRLAREFNHARDKAKASKDARQRDRMLEQMCDPDYKTINEPVERKTKSDSRLAAIQSQSIAAAIILAGNIGRNS